jgi:hypothetical protein
MVTLHKDKPTYGSSRGGYSIWKALPNGNVTIFIAGLRNLNIPYDIKEVSIHTYYPVPGNTYEESEGVEISEYKFKSIYSKVMKHIRNSIKVE